VKAVPDDPALVRIAAIVAAAPPLSAAQVARIRLLLAPAVATVAGKEPRAA